MSDTPFFPLVQLTGFFFLGLLPCCAQLRATDGMREE